MNVATHAQAWKRLPPFFYKLGAQAWIDHKYPRHLFIETTAACNLSCTYCPRESLSQHMDFSLFQQIIREATQFGQRSFSLHLFGEPTLYPQWTEAIRFIKTQSPKHSVLLTTNGTTLNRRVDDLISANPDLVLWSWRPEARFTPETKEKLRRWGKFRVRFIEELTPKEAYVEWADWPNVEGRPLHNYGGNISLEQFGSDQDSRKLSVSSAGRWPCYHLWLAPAVAWNGHILICCADPAQQEIIGTFPSMTVAQAWKSEKLRLIRESHLNGKYGGICSRCDIWRQYPNIFFGHEYPVETLNDSSPSSR